MNTTAEIEIAWRIKSEIAEASRLGVVQKHGTLLEIIGAFLSVRQAAVRQDVTP